MQDVIILGTGNVAEHLFKAFSSKDSVQVTQVYGRNSESLKKFSAYTETCSDPKTIKDAAIYIIAVNDMAIAPVSKLLSNKKGIIVHTSGAISIDDIASKNAGIFYPLQTFTKGKTLDFKSIPICIEAKQKSDLIELNKLASSMSDHVHEITSEQRKKLHLAAVFSNNFTNHLYQISKDLCKDSGLSFSLLKPLIKETADKVQYIPPKDAQTGPARRGDKKSIESHLNLLKNKKQTELYILFSEAITKMYEEKL
ncbi:Rossmann-like and DUF2520 domain-containing protein [Flagellimonas pacifica]|uniref:Predicted oxidoreductase, contains short-chain dehydrogenase (SDR) and DUF2520 domains n=1 Tax=Flagellimonas pacifica TaxID=1247520 RepID=A0A285MV96_9FLAO|nr:Rossmann-like and DUF2520 domain-containing protein [Allomuricauda parva]SNY99726.1 Predicted oxidoreductase, contains short-chain dehydrogenase (SDR) and DUF2520 domains [Allomuricauda parva]